MARDTKISVEEFNRRLDQTARDLKQFISEPDRRDPVVFRDGDHVSVRILAEQAGRRVVLTL